MSTEHYYLVIDEQGVSEITQAESPTDALGKYYGFNENEPQIFERGSKWRVFEGRADHHYIAYQFYFSGPMTGRAANIVDLGSVNAYDAPGLPTIRMVSPCVQLRRPCPLLDGSSCTHDLDG